MTFYEQVQDYSSSLVRFVRDHELPMEMFAYPDHLAVKARDRKNFDEIISSWKEYALGGVIHAVDMDGRTLASLQTARSIDVEPFGSVEWLEIMEPRAEKVGKGVVGLEHMEFFVADLDEVSRTLSRHGVRDYDRQKNDGHAWVNVVINAAGQEVKFNDKPLAAVLCDEADQGLGYQLP